MFIEIDFLGLLDVEYFVAGEMGVWKLLRKVMGLGESVVQVGVIGLDLDVVDICLGIVGILIELFNEVVDHNSVVRVFSRNTIVNRSSLVIRLL